MAQRLVLEIPHYVRDDVGVSNYKNTSIIMYYFILPLILYRLLQINAIAANGFVLFCYTLNLSS